MKEGKRVHVSDSTLVGEGVRDIRKDGLIEHECVCQSLC